MKTPLLFTALLLFSFLNGKAIAEETGSQIGRQVADFTLSDFLGTEHSLRNLDNSKLVVLAFLGTECPLARLYGPRLEQIAAAYKKNEISK